MSVAGGIQGLHFINTMSNAGLIAGSSQAKGIMSGLAGDIKKIAPFAPLAAGALILGKLADDAYEFSNEYSKAMREVQTISKAVQDDWVGMSKAIIDLAANGPDDAIELAKAYYQIVSAGYDGAAGLNLLDVASRAATAGITDTKTAADGLTTILNAWGKDASEAEKVADILFKTVEKGKTTFPELAQNIATVAPMAAAMNISLEEVTGAIATLTKQGNTTPTALTQIRQAIIALNENLGDGWSKVMTFQEGVQRLRDMAGGSDTKLKEMTGRVEGMNAILALTGTKAKEAADDLNTMTTATGSMQTAYETMMLEADNKWSMVHNKWQRELTGIGEAAKIASSGIADLFNALLTNQDDLTNKAPVIGGFQDRVAANRMLGDSKLMSYINAMSLFPSKKNSYMESRLQGIIDKAQDGFSGKENQLSKILGIDDAVERAKELSAFLSAMKNERAGESAIRTIGDESVYQLRAKNWENIISLIEDAIKKAEEFDSGGGGGDKPKPKAWSVSDSLKKIDELKSKLGTGNVANEIELKFKIADEQAKINAFYEKVREAFSRAINESLDNTFNRTAGADGTNSKIKTVDGSGELISEQAKKYQQQTQEITKQLAPMKRLTAEEEKQLKAESDKLDAQFKLQQEYEKTAKLVHYTSQILDAVSQITTEYAEQLGLNEKQSEVLSRSLGAMSGIARMASGDIVGGAAQLVTSALDLFLSAPEKLSEQYAKLREQINGVIEAANIANEALSNVGSDVGGIKALALMQTQLTGLIDDAERLKDSLPADNESYGRRTGTSTRTGEGTNLFRSGYIAVRSQINELESLIDELSGELLSGRLNPDLEEAIKELLTSYNGLMAEMDSLTQSIIGTSISDLNDSLADVFFNGEDAAEQWGEKVNDVIGNISKKQLIAKLLTEPVTNAIDALIQDMSDSGGITNDELANFVANMNAIYDDVAPQFQAALDALSNVGINLTDSAGYNELRGISRSITEETGSLLVGQVMSVREYQIRANDTMLDQLSVAEDNLEVLKEIRDNTAYNSNLKDIKEGIDDLNSNIKQGLGI